MPEPASDASTGLPGLCYLWDRWRAGFVSDAQLAEAATQAVSELNRAFDRLRAESQGAIDATASVRISLPRPQRPSER